MLKRGKRFIAAALATVLFANSCFTTLAAALPVDPAEESYTVTDGDLVAYAYKDQLSDAEKALLTDDSLVKVDEYTVVRPTTSEGLVTIDQENKTIEAVPYGTTESLFVPTAAFLVEEGKEKVEIPLSNGEGTYVPTSDNYSVEVVYTFTTELATDVQEKLLKTPAVLKEGVENLKKLKSAQDYVEVFEDSADLLVDIAVVGIKVGDRTLQLFQDDKTGTAIDAIKYLQAELEGDNELTLNTMLNGASISNTAEMLGYMLGTSERVDKETVKLYNAITEILEHQTFENIDMFYGFGMIDDETYDNVELAKKGLKQVKDALAPVAEEWDIFTVETAVVDGVNTEKLAEKVEALTTTAGKDVVPASAIKVDSVVLEATVNLVTITVKVNAEVVKGDTNSAELKNLEEKTGTVKVVKGTTKAYMMAKIEAAGIVDTAVNEWGLPADNFVKTTNEAELPAEAGDEDLTFTVDFTPKTVTVTENWVNVPFDVPYGYVYGFAKHDDPEKAFLYKAYDKDFEQGQTVKITKDVTITRSTDRAKQGYTWASIVAKALSETKAQDILKAEKAFTKDYGTVRVKLPKAGDELAKANLTDAGTKVTAITYDSGYEDLAWVPVAATANGTTKDFVKDGEQYVVTFDFNETEITVEYRLTLTNGEAKEIANLPHVLATEAAQQIAELDSLAAYKPTLDSNASYISLVGMVFGFSDKFTSDLITAFENFKSTGLYEGADGEDYLRLSQYLGLYEDNGLVYYYTGGADAIQGQVDDLKNLLVLLNNDTNKEALEEAFDEIPSNLIPADMTLEDITGRFDEIIAFLDDYQPLPMNAAINNKSADLAVLVNALTAAGTTKEYAQAPELYLSTTFLADVAGKVTATLTQVYNGETKSVSTILDATTALTQDDYNAVMAKWAELEAEVDKVHYTAGAPEVEGVELKVGQIPSTVEYIKEWNPVKYTVKIEGAEDHVFTYNGQPQIITLPKPATFAEQYTYSVPGKGEIVVKADADGQVTLTVAEVDAVAVDRVITITKTVQDVSEIEFLALGNKMNENLGSSASSVDAKGRLKYAFMPFTSASGEKVMVMRNIYTGMEFDYASLMTSLGIALADYGYIAMGGYPIWNGTALSLQGLTNAMIDAGVGMDTFRHMIDANGDIVELNLGGATYMLTPGATFGKGTIGDIETLGGKLVETTLSFGANEQSATTVKFYITLEDFDAHKAELKKLDSGLAAVAKYVDINSVDGRLAVDMTVPEAAYQLYLTYMLLEREITFDTMNGVELETLLPYIRDITEDVVGDLAAGEKADPARFFTTMTIENTIKQYISSFKTDLDAYGSAVKKVIKVLDLLLTAVERNDVVYSGSSVTTTLRYDDVKGVVGKLNSMAAAFISDTEMTIPTKVTLKNAEEAYDAYVIDLPDSRNVTKEDVMKIFKMSRDITTDLNNVTANSYIMLLNDVNLTKDVNIKGDNVIIDLNGFDITGNLNATGTGARIVDNTLSTKDAGVVTGNVTGNFTLYAGKYTADVTAMVAEGHEIEDGYVRNEAYLLEETDTELKVILEGDLFDTTAAEAKHSLVNAVFNIATNFYPYNTVKVDGQNLVSIGSGSLYELVTIAKGGRTAVINEALEYVYPKGVEVIVNGVLSAIADLESLATSTGEIYSVDLTLNPWDILYTVEGGTSDDAYLSVGYRPDTKNVTEKTLSFYITDGKLKELAAAAGEILDIKGNPTTGKFVELGEKVVYNGGTSFSLEHAGHFELIVDLSKDVNYSLVLMTVLANNAADKAPYTAAVNNFTSTGSIADVKALLDNTTVAQLIAALKAANGKDFAKMVKAMNFADADRAAAVVALESKYATILDILYKALIKAGVDGNSLKFKQVEGEYGVYDIDTTKFNVYAKVGIKFFNCEPEIVKLIPSLSGHEDYVFGYRVVENEETGYLLLDVHAEGITETQFINFVKAETEFADTVTVELGDDATAKNLEGANVVKTGAQFTVIAANNAGSKAEKTYTVVILGDTNSNGRTEAGDAAEIQKDFVHGNDGMTDLERAAGDVNCNERLESGDASQIKVKRQEYQIEEVLGQTSDYEYTSRLKNKAEKVDVETDELLGMLAK